MINTTLWTALITPMYQSGEIHFGDLEKLIIRQELAGNGVLLVGSTGEGLALNDDEKKEIIDFSANLEVSVPVMAGVGGFQIENQKAWIQYCNDKVDAFLLVSPLYTKPGSVGLKNWFQELMDVADKPCMIYNIPSRTGVKITPKVIKDLSGHSKFWSIKEASGSIADYQEFSEMVPKASMFSGDDGLLPYFAVAGCSVWFLFLQTFGQKKQPNMLNSVCRETRSHYFRFGSVLMRLSSLHQILFPLRFYCTKKELLKTLRYDPR